MEFVQQLSLGQVAKPAVDFAAPPCLARFSPVFWEPVAGTGERVVALIALEPDERSTTVLSSGTHCVLSAERLRALLGKQRGQAAHGVLKQTAEYMTHRQQAGLPIAELDTPFHGFTIGPELHARGYSIEQLLDAAVRSVSAFGSANELIEDEEPSEKPRHTVKTSEFINVVKRYVAGDDPAIKARFDKTLQPGGDLPDLTVDYAYHRWLLQVTSLPSTQRQSVNTLRESQSKLYEIEMIRRHMKDNQVNPVLLVNTDVLLGAAGGVALDEATRMLERLKRLSKAEGLELVESATPSEAASFVCSLK